MRALSYRLRLRGERSRWLSKRPPCRPLLTRMRCRYEGRTTDARLWMSYVAPASQRVAYSVRLPQRSEPARRAGAHRPTVRCRFPFAVRPPEQRAT